MSEDFSKDLPKFQTRYPLDPCPGGGSNPKYFLTKDGEYKRVGPGTLMGTFMVSPRPYDITCDYNENKDSQTTGLQALSKAIDDDKRKLSSRYIDPRLRMYESMKEKACSKPEFLNMIVTHDLKTCKDWDTSQALAKEWCEQDNVNTKEGNIVDDTLNLCTSAHLGTDLYNTLAEEYCKIHPDAEFCKCYNVVHYNTVCANRGTSKGCAVAKTKLDSIEEKLGVENATDALPCGTVCAGANVYKPDGFQSGCDITYNACIQKIDVGATESEINAACNIDSGAEGQLTSGSSGSSGSGSVSNSAIEELKKTIAEKEEKEEEEAKKTKKKLIIGGGGGGIVSIISCLMLIVIAIMVMSKKGGKR